MEPGARTATSGTETNPAPGNAAGAGLRVLADSFPSELNPTALCLLLGIAFLALVGSLYYSTYASGLQPFDVNGELTGGFYVPVLFSGGLLFAASWSALRQWRGGALPGWGWLGISALFAFMGLDELATVHEHLERWTGVDWQLLYLPVAALGGVFWLGLLDAMRSSLARLMWLGGLMAWVLAQAFEHLEFDSHDHPVAAAPSLILGEEIGEMIGSSLFLLAILVFAHARRR